MDDRDLQDGVEDAPADPPPGDPPRVTLNSVRERFDGYARKQLIKWALGICFGFFALSVIYGIQGNNYWPCAIEFVFIAAFAFGLDAWLKKKRAEGSSLCENCGKDLAGLPASGQCPDCDTPFHWNPQVDIEDDSTA